MADPVASGRVGLRSERKRWTRPCWLEVVLASGFASLRRGLGLLPVLLTRVARGGYILCLIEWKILSCLLGEGFYGFTVKPLPRGLLGRIKIGLTSRCGVSMLSKSLFSSWPSWLACSIDLAVSDRRCILFSASRLVRMYLSGTKGLNVSSAEI